MSTVLKHAVSFTVYYIAATVDIQKAQYKYGQPFSKCKLESCWCRPFAISKFKNMSNFESQHNSSSGSDLQPGLKLPAPYIKKTKFQTSLQGWKFFHVS